MHHGQAVEAAALAQLWHGEGGARIVFSLGRDAIVAGDIVEVIGGDEELCEGEDAGELRGGKFFPFQDGAAVAVAGAQAFEAGLFPRPTEGAGVAPGVGDFHPERVAVHAHVFFPAGGIDPTAAAGMRGGAIEGPALEDAAIAIDDDVRRDAALAHGFHAAGGGGAAGEVADEGAPEGEGGAAGERGAGGVIEEVVGDGHWGDGRRDEDEGRLRGGEKFARDAGDVKAGGARAAHETKEMKNDATGFAIAEVVHLSAMRVMPT